MHLTQTIVDWAKARHLHLESVPVDRKSVEKLLEDTNNANELCQSALMSTYISNCGGYPECKHVHIWKASYKHKIVGLMMMSTMFNLQARGWPQGYEPDHINFLLNYDNISDLLLVCSKDGPPGLGQLLTLLALSLSRESGLFLQLQSAFVQMKIHKNQLENVDAVLQEDLVDQSYLVSRPLYLESAKHIYGKMNFHQILVTSSITDEKGDLQISNLGVVCYYRDQPLEENELQQHLARLNHKFTSQAAYNDMLELQQTQNQMEQQLLTNLDQDPTLGEQLVTPVQEFGQIPYNSNGIATFEWQDPSAYDNNLLDAGDPLAGQNVIYTPNSPVLYPANDITLNPILYNMHEQEQEPLDIFEELGSEEEEEVKSPQRRGPGRPRRTTEENTCPICKKTFPRGTNLRRHMVKHNKDEKKLQCEYCEYKTNRTDDLKKHVTRRHSEEKTLQCPSCSYTTATKTDLQRHESTKHKKSRQKK